MFRSHSSPTSSSRRSCSCSCMASQQRIPRVAQIGEAAVVGQHALVGGYAAWFLARVIENTPGGLERVLARSGVPLERRVSVLQAHAALGEAGTRWQLNRAGATAGTGEPGADADRLPSEGDADPLGVQDVAVILC